MSTLRSSPSALAIQYSILAVFAANGLLSAPLFSFTWWSIAVLCAAMAVLIFFWPERRAYVLPYLLAETALYLGLTYFEREFMFLGFTLSVHIFLLLPLRSALVGVGLASLALEALLVYLYGWSESFYPVLMLFIGFVSVGYAYHQRDQALRAREETQNLLDELREAHHHLEVYAAQAQELAAVEERNRLARELHDSVKQQAFAVSAQLGAARALLTTDPAAGGDHLRKAEALMDEVRAELTQLIYQLRPAALQNQGLVAALREWGAGWSQRCGIKLDVQAQNERSMALDIEQALFRIAQEALANVARHSQARQVDVLLEYQPRRVRLTIQDDGLGFDPHTPAGPGIGLRSMQERVERLNGGAFELASLPGKGTRITVSCQTEQQPDKVEQR